MAGPSSWSVRRGDATVFLFGVRPGARDPGWISESIHDALAVSDEFWRETPPEEEIIASPLLAEFGLSPDVALSARLDDETRARLDAAAHLSSIDRPSLEHLRPWIVAQLLQQGTLERAAIPPDQNMDVVLTQLAAEGGAAVRYEFSVEGIIRVFGDMPGSVEVDYLRMVLDAAEGGPALIDDGFSAWLRGDGSLEELGDAQFRGSYPELYDWLIRERNLAWLPRIDAMLDRPGTRFVAVGCMHLAGPDSVLAVLTQLDCLIAPAAS